MRHKFITSQFLSSSSQVVSVEGNCLILGGADIVDGSPVLDIKPYLPFSDGVPHASAPAWVKVSLVNFL